jgi:hypothetical protein
MVGEEEVTDINNINDLPQGAGKNDALKPKEIFEDGPHLELTRWRSPTVRTLELVGYTYFIRAGASIKIGSAANFKSRFQSLQTAHERPLEVLAVVPASVAPEYETHQQFAHLRTRGEWFRADRELLQFIERIAIPFDPPVVKKPLREPKAWKAPKEPTLIEKLHALRREHGPTSATGYHCSNLTEILPAYQAATDAVQRAYLAASARRQMAGLVRLRADLQ